MATKSPSRAIKLFGTEMVDPPGVPLKAGPLSAELDNGALRYVRLGDVEVLRGIAFLVRDENWGTYVPAIADLKVEQGTTGFEVTYGARCTGEGRALSYRARITGRADGRLRFEAEAGADTDFLTNRTGFVVLHPLRGVVGRPVEVLHTDGRVTRDRFPEIIDPVQPFKDIRALTHEVLPGLRVTCRMEGDQFEMEDHRNWTDASYKTYVRPLALPRPYKIGAGETFTQSVSLDFDGDLPAESAGAADRPVTVMLGEALGTMPRIGLGLPAGEAEHALAALDLVRGMGMQILVCQVDRRQGHGVAELRRYKALAEATGAEAVLEIVLPGKGDPAEELAPLAEAARQAGLVPAAIAVSPAAHLKAVLPGSVGPKVPSFEAIYAAARQAFRGVALGGGMFSFFTELNRQRPPVALLDFVTHTTNPIVHAADDRSVMETLEALPYVIRSARAIIGDKAYRVGPSAIAARDNPYGAATAPNPDNGRVCLADMDPRQRGLFGAAWLLGYVANFARGGAEAVSLGAPTGPLGFVYRKADFRQPWFDAVPAAQVYPAYHVMAGLAAAAARPLLQAQSSDGSRVEALAYRRNGSTVLWLANLTATEQAVDLENLPGGAAALQMLDEASFERAATDPAGFAKAGRPLEGKPTLTLGAYAVARLEARP